MFYPLSYGRLVYQKAKSIHLYIVNCRSRDLPIYLPVTKKRLELPYLTYISTNESLFFLSLNCLFDKLQTNNDILSEGAGREQILKKIAKKVIIFLFLKLIGQTRAHCFCIETILPKTWQIFEGKSPRRAKT